MIAFSNELNQNRERTPEAFLQLTTRYRDATDPDEVTSLPNEWVRGFCGPNDHAWGPASQRAGTASATFGSAGSRAQNHADQLVALREWLMGEPGGPSEPWLRINVCGDGELVKTFLVAGQIPSGRKL